MSIKWIQSKCQRAHAQQIHFHLLGMSGYHLMKGKKLDLISIE